MKFFILFIFCIFSLHAEKLVILGSGPAGLTAAIHAGSLAPLIIEGNECDGQLVTVSYMENFPGFPDGINGEELIERMRVQAQKFGARFQSGAVKNLDFTQYPYCLTLESGENIFAESLIVALGTSKRWLGLDSEDALKGKGVCSSATCEAPLFAGKEVVVVGGGDAALEEALALSEYASKVSLVYRGETLSASQYLQNKLNEKIEVILNSAVDEILSNDRVTGIVIRNSVTEEKSVLPCEGIFVSIGRKPNTALFEGKLKLNSSGLIVVNGTETNVPGVFAAGDVCDASYRKAITAAGMGCMAAMDAIRFIESMNSN